MNWKEEIILGYKGDEVDINDELEQLNFIGGQPVI